MSSKEQEGFSRSFSPPLCKRAGRQPALPAIAQAPALLHCSTHFRASSHRHGCGWRNGDCIGGWVKAVTWRCTQKTKHLIDAGAQQFGPEVLYAELKQKRRVLPPFSGTLSRAQVHSTLIFPLLPLLPSRPPYRCPVFAPTLLRAAESKSNGGGRKRYHYQQALSRQSKAALLHHTVLCNARPRYVTRHTRMSSS
jgi:hypothetical protein